MGKSFRRAILALTVLGLLASPASAVFSINLAEEPMDYSTVSPGARTVQVVQVLDGDGDPVNQSRLEENSVTVRYSVNGTYHDMDHLKNGYYYAEIDDGGGEEVVYELADASPTTPGEVNTTEELKEGRLDLELLSNLSSDMEAGEEFLMEARVEDLGDYYAVDTDGSGGVSNSDTFIRDRGGSGTYSSRADGIVAGTRQEDVSASTANPWSGVEHPVSFLDAASGDNWNPSSDSIMIDRNAGGTVSVEADETLNTGDDSDTDSSSGQGLNQISSIRDSVYLVSPDSSMDSGEITVYDNDSDGVYTKRADVHVAGVEPSEGTDITHQNMVPSTMGLSAYDASSGDSWNSDTDALVNDRDDDGMYTGTADLLLAGSSPSPRASLNTNDVAAWNDGNAMVATQGDVEVVDQNLGDPWNPDADAIWLESGSTNGFQPDEDTVLAGSPESGMSPTQTSGLFNQWELISAYRADNDDTFDMSEDGLIRESNGGGTFSTEPDEVAAGTSSIPEGAQFTVNDGIPGDWSIDTVDINSGDAWDPSRDSLIIDSNDGGTYSTVADEVLNAGGGSAGAGTNLVQFNSVSSGQVRWTDIDESGSYSSGDEVVRDLDEDGIFTSEADQSIAGLSPDTAGAGRSLTTNNPWDGVSEALMFYNGSSTSWDSTGDFITRDMDQDGVYTSQSDIIVKSGESAPENGAELMDASGWNLTFPDITVAFTTGNTTTGVMELGKNPDGTYSNTVELPDEANSTIVMQMHANAPRAETEGSLSRIIETRKRGIGFSAESEIEVDVDRAGIYERNITLENHLEEENRIHVEAGDDISDRVEMASEIVLEPGGESNFTVSINATPAEDFSGEIEFTENSTGITDTTDVSVTGPECVQRTNRLCTSESGVSMTAEERGDYSRSLTLRNIWSSDVQVSASLTGNITQVTSLETQSFTLSDNRDFNVTFTTGSPGTYEGELSLASGGNSVNFDLTFVADVRELNRGMSISPSTADLGTIPEGNDVSKEFTLENTGTLELRNLNVSSSYSIEENLGDSLAAGEQTTFTVTFNSPSQQSGQMTVTGEADTGSVTKTVELSLSTVKPVSEMKSELRSRISDLRSRASSSDTLQQITGVESRINSIQTQWDRGNYGEAQRIYQNSLSELNSIEIQEQPSNQTQGPGPGQPSPPPTEGTDSNNGGGGGGIIIIFIVLLLIILIAGFIIYTSYYPEEGDPLYGVLGEE